MKASELTGADLDRAVAKCVGAVYHGPAWTKYSTDWSQGGPIIEREGMHVDCLRQGDRPIWEAWPYSKCTKHIQQGPTPLIAAMRCYVASQLGEDVDVPDALTKGEQQ